VQAQLFMLDFQGARYTMDGEVPKQAGNNHPTSIPTGVFETADGFINIAVAGATTWERFARSVDGEAWLDNADYATSEARSHNRDALNADIAEKTRNYTSADLIDLLVASSVPCGEINDIAGAFENPQTQHLQMAQPVTSAALGEINLVAQPVRLERTPSVFEVAPPERGEHTDEVLQGLGYSATDIEQMRTAKVV